MQELIEQQQVLKRRKFRNNLALNFHAYILPNIGIFIMIAFYNHNNTLSLVGSIILLYILSIGVNLIIPYCNNHNYDVEKELQQLSKTLENIKAINQSLDNHRDKMLFDDDPSYWQILEKLDTQN